MILNYLASTVFINSVQFGALATIAVVLTPELYGNFRVLHAYWLTAATLGLMGLNQSIVREDTRLVIKQSSNIYPRISILMILTALITTLGAGCFVTMRYGFNAPLIGSFFFCIYGYGYFSLMSARIQAEGDDNNLLKIQTMSKVMVFVAATIASFSLSILNIFVAIAFSYAVLFCYINKSSLLINCKKPKLANLYSLEGLGVVLKNSLWPWLMAIVAILSQHIEFLLSQNFNLGDDSVGKLAYANLIFLGITSAFFAFQNFTLTRYSDGTLTAAKINQYQLLAIGVMLVACAIAFTAVQFLHFIMPEKFDNLFIHYSVTVRNNDW